MRCCDLLRCSVEDRDSSKNLAGQSAQTETLASFDLTLALPSVALIFSSIVVAEDPAAPSAVSSIDKMKQPKRPPLRSTRLPSAPTTAATQSAHAIPAHARSYLTSPEKVQRPELRRTQDYRPWQEWFPRTLTDIRKYPIQFQGYASEAPRLGRSPQTNGLSGGFA